MFLSNWFGGGSNYKKSKKGSKKKQKETQQQVKTFINPVKNVVMFGQSKMGYGPKKTECQDSFCIMDQKFADDCYFFAVYDGHGSSGKEASQAANDYIQTYLEKNQKKIKTLKTDKEREQFLRQAFKTAETKLKQSGIDYSNSGTCSIAVFIQKNMVYVANLGDSRAVLYRQQKERLAIELSYDHKPTRPEEKERILKSGGKIERLIHDGQPVGPHRVWADDEGPGIAMTRTLGDLQAKKIGLISDPEIQHIPLNPKTDKFIVIGSDGIWDVMTSAEVVGFVDAFEPKEQVADALVNEARSRWDEQNKSKKNSSKIGDVPYLKYGCDDITAVVAFFQYIDEAQM